MKKIAVFTSGGDAPGMNACIRAVVRTALHYNLEVLGVRRGYAGMVDGEFIPMNSRSVSNIIQQGGTILQSARSEAFRTPEGRLQAYDTIPVTKAADFNVSVSKFPVINIGATPAPITPATTAKTRPSNNANKSCTAIIRIT